MTTCAHLDAAAADAAPLTPDGCEECIAEGWSSVALRLCLSCGHVGCCDSSRGRHATAHYAASRHPVMRSFEGDQRWRWCYVDELLG